jgi:hypothetical protein
MVSDQISGYQETSIDADKATISSRKASCEIKIECEKEGNEDRRHDESRYYFEPSNLNKFRIDLSMNL